MEPFELELKNALNRRTPMAAADAASLNDQIVRAYARKQRAVQNLTRAYLVGMTLVLILFFWLFLNTPDLKLSLLYGIAILIVCFILGMAFLQPARREGIAPFRP